MRPLFTWLLLLAFSSSAEAFTVAAPDLVPVIGRPIHQILDLTLIDPFTLSSGHEEITRQALIKTVKALNEAGIDPIAGNEKFLDDVNPRLLSLPSGALTRNKIISGNYCTDMPKHGSAMLSLIDFWGLKSNVDWHNDNNTQTIHFLRGELEDGTMMSAKQACIDARDKISLVAQQAVEGWLRGYKEDASFLLGHATHILQDSFSPAHTRRGNAASGYALRDICYYGAKRKNALEAKGLDKQICYHKVIDMEQDGVWINSSEEEALTKENWPQEDAKQAIPESGIVAANREINLKHEARLAREATVKFLFLIATEVAELKNADRRYDESAKEKLQKRLNNEFFYGTAPVPGVKDKFPNGVLNCNLVP